MHTTTKGLPEPNPTSSEQTQAKHPQVCTCCLKDTHCSTNNIVQEQKITVFPCQVEGKLLGSCNIDLFFLMGGLSKLERKDQALRFLADCFGVHIWHVLYSQTSFICVSRKCISNTRSSKPTICFLLSIRQTTNLPTGGKASWWPKYVW